jgi:hypothetical protein
VGLPSRLGRSTPATYLLLDDAAKPLLLSLFDLQALPAL